MRALQQRFAFLSVILWRVCAVRPRQTRPRSRRSSPRSARAKACACWSVTRATSRWTSPNRATGRSCAEQPRAQADPLRQTLDKAGLLGKRVYVQDGVGSLYLADDLADAIFIANNIKIPDSEVLRVLRPEGKAFVGARTLTKPFRAGTDEWSHPYHGPDNNPQSADKVMQRPFLTHYMVEPWYCPLPMQSVISGGRVFKVFGDRSSAKPQEPLVNKLLAMNAFNGTQLWQRPVAGIHDPSQHADRHSRYPLPRR